MRGGGRRDRDTERQTDRQTERERERERGEGREEREGGAEMRERSKEREEEREAIINQTNIGTVLNATLGKLLRDGVERIIMGFSKRINTILN